VQGEDIILERKRKSRKMEENKKINYVYNVMRIIDGWYIVVLALAT
jgi:hypothetical protein